MSFLEFSPVITLAKDQPHHILLALALGHVVYNFANGEPTIRDRMVLKNVVRGFSLVLHDPEGSHYKIWT